METLGQKYQAKSSPVANILTINNGLLYKSGKYFNHGDIFSGRMMSVNLGGHKRNLIKVDGGFVRPSDAAISEYSKADGHNYSGANFKKDNSRLGKDVNMYKVAVKTASIFEQKNGILLKAAGGLHENETIMGKPVSLTLSGTAPNTPFIQILSGMYAGKYTFPNSVIIVPMGNFSGADGSPATPVVIPPVMNALPTIIGSAGFIWGLYYSFSKKKGFWAYVGYSFLGSVGGTVAGTLIKVIAYPNSAQSFSGADGKNPKKPSPFKQKKCDVSPSGYINPYTGAWVDTSSYTYYGASVSKEACKAHGAL